MPQSRQQIPQLSVFLIPSSNQVKNSSRGTNCSLWKKKNIKGALCLLREFHRDGEVEVHTHPTHLREMDCLQRTDLSPAPLFQPSVCHSGPLDPRQRSACWVLYLSSNGCLDTPSKKMLWVTSSQESVWGSCSYRRVRLETMNDAA